MDLLWHGVTQMIHRRHAAIDGAACSSMADDLGEVRPFSPILFLIHR
jgi:hypothetical protein